MKVNLSFLKLVIRMLILMILFVVLFFITAFLYSARYWPDIYNYVNANITIKRIPTISELNLTIIEVEYVTETYSTTDFDYSDSTNSFDTTEDGFSFDEFDFVETTKSRVRRNAKLEEIGSDYSEVPRKTVVVDYFFIDESSAKPIKDLVDESKLTTRVLDVEIMNGGFSAMGVRNMDNQKSPTLVKDLFPWIAAIFVKNDSKGSQFEYFCDGAILNKRAILTAARCILNGNETYKEEDFIVILGKTSLQVSGDNEKILRVKSLKLHDNFTTDNRKATNDLAVLFMEEPIVFNEAIAPANLTDAEEKNEEEECTDVTTAWSVNGDLTLIYFDRARSGACGPATDNKVENTLCATYGDAVPLCPSYGGLFASRRADKLYLTGIRTGNPQDRGICFSKDVPYTTLFKYTKWISDLVENKYV